MKTLKTSYIENYFEYIIKKHKTLTDNEYIYIIYIYIIYIYICVHKIKNRIFKIKTWYFLELLMSATMKLLGSTKSKITKNENCENTPRLEITEIVLVHCNIVRHGYQHAWWACGEP